MAPDRRRRSGGLTNATALAVSADGAVVVGIGYTGMGRQPFIRDAMNGTRDLAAVLADNYSANRPGWTLVEARGLSADVLIIVGTDSAPSAQESARRAALPPTRDLTSDALSNGDDLQPFIGALVAGSTDPSVRRAADFKPAGMIDAGEIPRLEAAMLMP